MITSLTAIWLSVSLSNSLFLSLPPFFTHPHTHSLTLSFFFLSHRHIKTRAQIKTNTHTHSCNTNSSKNCVCQIRKITDRVNANKPLCINMNQRGRWEKSNTNLILFKSDVCFMSKKPSLSLWRQSTLNMQAIQRSQRLFLFFEGADTCPAWRYRISRRKDLRVARYTCECMLDRLCMRVWNF